MTGNVYTGRSLALAKNVYDKQPGTWKVEKEIATTRKKNSFLASLMQTKSIAESCKITGISRQTYEYWRDKDTSFKDEVEKIKEGFKHGTTK
jgi:hypothetical protein